MGKHGIEMGLHGANLLLSSPGGLTTACLPASAGFLANPTPPLPRLSLSWRGSEVCSAIDREACAEATNRNPLHSRPVWLTTQGPHPPRHAFIAWAIFFSFLSLREENQKQACGRQAGGAHASGTSNPLSASRLQSNSNAIWGSATYELLVTVKYIHNSRPVSALPFRGWRSPAGLVWFPAAPQPEACRLP